MQRVCFILMYINWIHCIIVKPFHSSFVEGKSEWICNTGYFRTQPILPQTATCKACSKRLSVDKCKASERFIPCSPLSNAHCESCPILHSFKMYVPKIHDCQTIRCIDGTYNSGGECILCPINSYCIGGTMSKCPMHTITRMIGADDPLWCLPDEKAILNIAENNNYNNISQTIELNVLWTTETNILSNDDQQFVICPNLAEMALNWMKFGLVMKCHVGLANYSQTIGGVQCSLLTTQAFSNEYIQWLTVKVQKEKTLWIQPFLQQCFNRKDLQVTEISIMPVIMSNSIGALKSIMNSTNNNNTRGPLLKYERRKWGTSQRDIIIFIISLSILSLGMCFSICMLACLVIKHHKIKKEISKL